MVLIPSVKRSANEFCLLLGKPGGKYGGRSFNQSRLAMKSIKSKETTVLRVFFEENDLRSEQKKDLGFRNNGGFGLVLSLGANVASTRTPAQYEHKKRMADYCLRLHESSCHITRDLLEHITARRVLIVRQLGCRIMSDGRMFARQKLCLDSRKCCLTHDSSTRQQGLHTCCDDT